MQTLKNLLILVQFCVIHQVRAEMETYKAAVVEYAPKLSGNSPADNIFENAREYTYYIQKAATQGVQIIVFPEDGLTGWGINFDSLEHISTEVPDPDQLISPCRSQRGNYSRFLMELSCSSWVHNMYTVVNLIEWQPANHSHAHSHAHGKIYHKTNVVFDRTGVVIARYRKINTFNEPFYFPGHKTVTTFKTDFGVTFGTFICSDILFRNPALDIFYDPKVTDVVFPAAWFSELPFLEALSIQHGYAKSNGINLLAAGLNDPTARNGGSGIYLHDGGIAVMHITGTKSSRLIVQNVPKIGTRRDLSNECQGSSETPLHGLQFEGKRIQPDIALFRTKESNLTSYTFKALNLENHNNRLISETVCSGEMNFCCTFNVTVHINPGTWPNYVYKLVAFHGVSTVSSVKRVGFRNCALVACLNDNDSSCGARHAQAPTGVVFQNIAVKGNFDVGDSYQQPSSLNFDLTPSTDYMYCTRTSANEVEIKLFTTKEHSSLLTFGIMGRVFANDDRPVGLISGGATFHLRNFCVVVATSFFMYFVI